MKRGTLNLVIIGSGAYYGILFLARSLFSADFTPPSYFLVIPLLILVLILVVDLSDRVTAPSRVRMLNAPSRRLSREVQQLSRRIEVGAGSSSSYFDRLLLGRLREILVERIALQTGMDKERIRRLLEDPREGPGLVGNEQLYKLLYNPPPARGPARVQLLRDAVAKVEDWKP